MNNLFKLEPGKALDREFFGDEQNIWDVHSKDIFERTKQKPAFYTKMGMELK